MIKLSEFIKKVDLKKFPNIEVWTRKNNNRADILGELVTDSILDGNTLYDLANEEVLPDNDPASLYQDEISNTCTIYVRDKTHKFSRYDITKEQFEAYKRIQESGECNMVADAQKVMEQLGFDEETYFTIQDEYEWLHGHLLHLYIGKNAVYQSRMSDVERELERRLYLLDKEFEDEAYPKANRVYLERKIIILENSILFFHDHIQKLNEEIDLRAANEFYSNMEN